jgi:hypothetical protein
MRRDRAKSGAGHVDFAGYDRGEAGSVALIGNMEDVDARRLLECFHQKIRPSPDPE